MIGDPWEMQNIAEQAQHAATIAEHQRLLGQWNSRMQVAPEPG